MRLLGGRFKGQEVQAYNLLTGSLQTDKIYEKGDIASEILHTIVGSFGLVAVAPFTALMGGLLLVHDKGKEHE